MFFVLSPRKYTGQEKDKESGLYYYNARYYDPKSGIFVSPDPAMSGLNHYAYCSANPVNYTDPTGLDSGPGAGYGGWSGPNGMGASGMGGADSSASGQGAAASGGEDSGGNDSSLQGQMGENNEAWDGNGRNENGEIGDPGITNLSLWGKFGQKLDNHNEGKDAEVNVVLAQESKNTNVTDNQITTSNGGNNRTLQTDPGITGTFPEFGTKGCLARSLMGIAETYTGKTLTVNQIKELITYFQTTKISGGRDLTQNILSSNMNVNNKPDIINKTLGVLGSTATASRVAEIKNGVISYINGFDSSITIHGSTIMYNTSYNPPTHFVQGNILGNRVLFDPSPGLTLGSVGKVDFYNIQ